MEVPEGLVEAAFDASPTQSAILDDSGEIVYTNRAWRTFGAENGLAGDVIGQNYLRVCEESDDERAHRIADGIRSLLEGERGTVSVEYPCHGPDEKRWFTMRAEGFGHDDDRYALVVHLDITDRRLAERRVREHNERLETMTQVLAHDLRNPLSVAFAYATRLESDAADAIAASLERMETIIEDVLVLARRDGLDETRTVELRERARAAWGQVETADASLEIAGSASFEADPDLLDHVFENLFRNAVEHAVTGDDAGSGDGPAVSVRVGALGSDSADDVAGFYVEDDGPGIPEAERDAVLERGYTTESVNTGLGLAIVAHVVDVHGWTVSITEGTSGGARFEIRF